MRKFLIALALVASPAVAEPVMPGPDASYEERREYMNQIRAEDAKRHQQVLAQLEQQTREFKIKIGLDPDAPAVGSGRGCRYSCTTTVIYRGRVHRFQVTTR
jgi:hypothetical protein